MQRRGLKNSVLASIQESYEVTLKYYHNKLSNAVEDTGRSKCWLECMPNKG